jgi:Lar family restriction alleviation protein
MTDTLKPAELELEALKPCPFCGGADVEINQIGNDFTKSRGFEVKCLARGCATKKRAMVIRQPIERAREFAIAAWNRRAPDPRIEALEAEVRRLELSVLDGAISDRLDEAGSPLTWQEVALSAEAQRDRMREALTALRNRVYQRTPSERWHLFQQAVGDADAALSQESGEEG